MSEETRGYTAFCTECKTVLPDSVAEKDAHLQAGHPGVCKLCGGVVAVAKTSEIERAKGQSDYQRGLG